ncbi:peptidoglycan recognition protein [Kitasatospora sp. NPDC050543]|uniref:peptidoglycan recognition protein n=1 Tax=Kitasatospora sp. NPDC050543 TaxID=3364054 RepID=UPI0037BCAD5B
MDFSILTVLGAASTAALILQPAASGAGADLTARHAISTGAGGVTTIAIGTSQQRSATGERTLEPRTTGSFTLVGVSWDDPRADLDGGVVQVRTRDAATGVWSDWHQLSADNDDAPDPEAAEHTGPGTRGATAPLWTGPSDGVAVKVTPGRGALPAGLRAELVDPGTGVAAGAPRDLPAESGTPADNEAPRPGIVTRSGWGADESIREPGYVYTGQVKAVFVHHTDTTNDYACSDSPAMIRSIYTYHVKTNGWRDIGYNFLVDKCGTIYEGRAGGVANPVLGAHTLGFNTNSAGVAALGTFISGTVPQPLADGVSKIAAWKLGLTGQDAGGETTLVSGSSGSRYPAGTTVTFNTISGHRDGFATECPGSALYARLGDIRVWAAHLQGRS